MAHVPSFDANGLVTLTLEQINENIEEYVHGASDLGPDVSMGDHTIGGMVAKGAAVEIEQVYRALDDLWAGLQADAAEGVPQDNINRLRGAVRNPARYSTATVTCSGTPATSISAGKIVAIPNGGERWLIDETVVIPGGGSIDVGVTAENTGAIEAAIGAITEIVTGVSGWTGVTNAAEATLGEAVESDADYRNRSENTTTGSVTEEAVYTRLSEQDDIDAVVVVSNRTDTIDADGIPPYTQWIVIYPNTADQQNIAETIWGEAGSVQGIPYRGAVTATVTDINGFESQIAWDWATAVDLWVSIVGTKNDLYPIDGDDLIEDAVTAYFATVRVGADADPAPIESACVVAVPGIVTIEARLKVGGAPGPGDTSPIVIDINEYADLNATIGVTMT
jgi:hypothetical protein